jgi:hypothetical protein
MEKISFNLLFRPLRGRNLYPHGGKRALDVSAAALGLLLLAPALPALAALVRWAPRCFSASSGQGCMASLSFW